MRRPILAAFLLLAATATTAHGGEGEHLDFCRTYADALLRGRIRNVPVLVARHKDECGRCERQYANVLTNRAFVRWVNAQGLPVLIAHNELGHDPVLVEDEDGGLEERCPLYPGMTCRDHLNAAVDIENARGEGLVPVPFVELCPNTWLVLPDGTVERIAEKDQFDAKKVREIVEAKQKALGTSLSPEDGERVREDLEAARASLASGERWRETLEALAAVAKRVPQPPAALRALVDAVFTETDDEVAFVVEDALEAASPSEADRALLRGMLAATDVEVYGRRLPVRERIAARLR